MSSPCITISPHELLSISPDARAKIRENVTPRRTPTEPVVSTNVLRSPDPAPDDPLPFANNALISTNPIKAYINSLKPNEPAGPFIVAKESHALCSIVIQVDNQKSVESVVDPGSQIIAMSEDVCHSLGLPYDPSIILHMQSANGEVDKSLGLARNVPCTVGSVMLYLQIHVIRSPAYDILLGRPFEVLTESMVQNYSNKDQTITIADPNSNRTVTIPTIARGQHKKLAKPPCNGVSQLETLIGDQGDVALIISFDSIKMTGHIESYTPIPMACPDSVSFDPLSYVSAPSDSSDSDSPLLSSFTTYISDSGPATDAATYSSILTRIYLSACDLPPLSVFPTPASSFSYSASQPTTTPNRDDFIPIFALPKKKYKPVALKTRPILAELPDKFRIVRNIIGDPLADMPTLSPNPPPFQPTGRYTSERRDTLNKVHCDFLTPDELALMDHFMSVQNKGFAWTDAERGRFCTDFFPPIDFSVVPHTPWVQC